MPDQAAEPAEVAGADIIFECPNCGKSLAISSRGAGLTVACPGCRERIQVPNLPAVPAEGEAEPVAADPRDQRIEELTTALEGAHNKIERLVESLEETRSRRKFLEEVRVENMDRFDAISRELGAIQASLDRIVATIQQVDMNRESKEEA
jgi:hypothetical protein